MVEPEVPVLLTEENSYLGNVLSFLFVNGQLKGILHGFSPGIIVQNFCMRLFASECYTSPIVCPSNNVGCV